MSDDLFNISENTEEQPDQNEVPQYTEAAQPVDVAATGDIDDMLAEGDDDDDLFGGANPPGAEAVAPAAHQDQKPSALIEWEKNRKDEIVQNDTENNKKDNELRTTASGKLDGYYKNLQEAQKKRSTHNLELDRQFVAAQQDDGIQQWERVVNYIDFNRSDLHERDVSRMKSLLLQLKH